MFKDLDKRCSELKASYRDVMLVPESELYSYVKETARENFKAHRDVFFSIVQISSV